MTDSTDSTQPTTISPKKGIRKSRFLKWGGIFLAFLALIGFAAILGYQQGITLRTQAEANQVVQVVDEQYDLALLDIDAGRYEIALQRLEYVAEIYPGYPGLTDNLAKVLIVLNTTATPTIAPSPTIEPTALPENVTSHTVLFAQPKNTSPTNLGTSRLAPLSSCAKKIPITAQLLSMACSTSPFDSAGFKKSASATLKAVFMI